MTDHVPMDIPDDYRLRKRLGTNYKQACFNCGKFMPCIGGYNCEYYLNQSGWMWGPGQPDDPFASMRTNGKALGTLGVGSHGMPIRDPGHTHSIGVGASPPAAPKPAETRPGLTEESIDRDAYDDFMRGL